MASGVVSTLVSLAVLVVPSFIPQVQAETPSTDVCVTQPPIGEVVVYVSGAVKSPGLYKLQPGSRLAEALELSGGALPTADKTQLQKSINLAEELTDSQHLYIPFAAELTPTAGESELTAVAFQQQTNPTTAQSVKISINTASQKELEGLPKVGAKTAEMIIAGRPYTDLFQLVGTKVLSQSAYDEIKGQLSL
jgi:competence protein ComEA